MKEKKAFDEDISYKVNMFGYRGSPLQGKRYYYYNWRDVYSKKVVRFVKIVFYLLTQFIISDSS